MAVRIKDWMIPYTWWIGIEITNNHVINVLLRELNNLIQVNDDRELYVDLQLPDGIAPDDDFPVWVTTGRILQEDWWQDSGIILNWKTTSWNWVRFIYADDWNLYYDPWTWEWILIGWWTVLADINTKTFYPQNLSDATVWQAVIDWYLAWKNPIIIYNGRTYVVEWHPQPTQLRFQDTRIYNESYMNEWVTRWVAKQLYLVWDAYEQFDSWMDDTIVIIPNYINAGMDYSTPYHVTYDSDPATKKYVDDGLVLKQDILTPWTRITIQNNVISADVSGVMTYMWNVTDSSQLPTTWNNQWDCWYDETNNTLWAWDGTQWNDIGGTWIDLSNYFNMQTNTTDNITEWNNKFVTAADKTNWNWKQDQLTAWDWITIDQNNVISADGYTGGTAINIDQNNVVNNTKPFDPENEWVLGQVLKKTSTGYRWNNEVEWFDPENAGSTGQVLKKTATWYQWANESWWGGWWWGWWGWGVTSVNGRTWAVTVKEVPSWWNAWDILTKTSTGYAWVDNDSNVKCFVVSWTPTQSDLHDIMEWIIWASDRWAILRFQNTQDVDLYSHYTHIDWTTEREYFFFSYRDVNEVENEWNGNHGSLRKVWHVLKYDSNTDTYTLTFTHFNTVTNFLVCSGEGYSSDPFMPTQDYQPTTKKYVDDVNWTWTLSEYNALQSIDPNKVYNITSLS